MGVKRFGEWIEKSVNDKLAFTANLHERSAAIQGWISYGAALNEGRALFPSDEQFGDWVAASQLGTHADGREIKRDDRTAAMWAAANPDQFEEARAADMWAAQWA